jgi:hypothetical protein
MARRALRSFTGNDADGRGLFATLAKSMSDRLLGGESASVTFCFAIRISSLPSPEMFDPLALRGGEHPYQAQEVLFHRE